MLYFDYASNMDEDELKGYISQHGGNSSGITNPRYAVLHDWRLVFNFLSPRRQAGTANIEPASGERVEGVVWDATDDVIKYIDLKEGHPNQYHQIRVTAEVHGLPVPDVLTYEVIAEQRRAFCPPRRAYRQLMIDAGHRFGFSPDYLAMLQNIRTLDQGG